MTEASVNQIIEIAKNTNLRRDRIDRENGLAAPPDCSTEVAIRTAMDALKCGMRLDDWNCIAEGYAILAEIPGVSIVHGK